jgi:hypothetical protein
MHRLHFKQAVLLCRLWRFKQDFRNRRRAMLVDLIG